MAITVGKKDIHALSNRLLLNKGDLVNEFQCTENREWHWTFNMASFLGKIKLIGSRLTISKPSTFVEKWFFLPRFGIYFAYGFTIFAHSASNIITIQGFMIHHIYWHHTQPQYCLRSQNPFKNKGVKALGNMAHYKDVFTQQNDWTVLTGGHCPLRCDISLKLKM